MLQCKSDIYERPVLTSQFKLRSSNFTLRTSQFIHSYTSHFILISLKKRYLMYGRQRKVIFQSSKFILHGSYFKIHTSWFILKLILKGPVFSRLFILHSSDLTLYTSRLILHNSDCTLHGSNFTVSNL